MNIIDAINSGQRFRRPGDRPNWFTKIEDCCVTNYDILATDWEIKERKIEITESEFDDAVRLLRPKPSLEESLKELKARIFEK